MNPSTLTLAALLLAAAPALAQDALGDGTALDQNLRQGSGGKNAARPDLARELQFRNAIVTGNAPGGLSFREDVGYTSPGGFRDALGSDDLFAFRRDSLYSGLAGLGIRGTDALQYQFGLTTGSTLPPGLRGSLQVERGFDRSASASSDTLFTQREESDDRGFALWALRSPASIVSTRGMQPAVISTAFTAEDGGRFALTASTLRGVHLDRLDYLRAGAKRPEPAAPAAAVPVSPDRPAEPTSPYQTLMEQLAQSGARAATPDLPEWEKQIQELRAQVLADEAEKEISQGTANILRDVGRLEELAPVAPTGFDAYTEHMRAGQDHLVKGRFFDAEERFTRALAARPDDTLAAVARVHAQLGAGMFLSATINLRTVFQTTPEAVGIRYGDQAMPSPERVRRLIVVLREGLKRENGLPPDVGLALAYLGFQSGDSDALIEGFALIEKSAAQGGTPSALLSLLRKVWLAPPSPPDAGK